MNNTKRVLAALALAGAAALSLSGVAQADNGPATGGPGSSGLGALKFLGQVPGVDQLPTQGLTAPVTSLVGGLPLGG
ncbi:hypothetical protein ACFYW8_12165 [Streptomyces sp. NPDC002742]|jgi:hypothetical protein|uniref:hypothetical protein n=1 Tax=unclassified Streptomyces TaxID=2593676 RepID=UPI00342BD7E9